MKYLFAIIGGLVVLLLLWLFLRPADSVTFTLPADDMPAYEGMDPTRSHTGGMMPLPGEDEAEMPSEFDGIALDQDAINSLRGAREFGDPRTPPIGRSAPPEQATEEELADPEKYAEFEARQERKVKRAYVIEAEKYTQQLREDIEKGKAMGIPPDEIAKVQEKVRRIEAMRAKLLAEDPGLLDPGSPLPPRRETVPPPGTDKPVAPN